MKKCIGHPFVIVVLVLSLVSISSAETQDALEQEPTVTAYNLSDVDEPPRVIRKIDPLYPYAALRKGDEATVTLRFIVTKEGYVVDPSVVKRKPLDGFDNSALKAILRWRFKPAIKDGEAVDVIIVEALTFRLDGRRPVISSSFAQTQAFNELVERGSHYSGVGMYQDAVEAYSQLVELAPKSPGVYYNRGFVYSKWGKHRKAIKDFSKAIKLNPDTMKYYVARAISYKELNKLRKVCADLKSACDLGDCTRLNLAISEGVCE